MSSSGDYLTYVLIETITNGHLFNFAFESGVATKMTSDDETCEQLPRISISS